MIARRALLAAIAALALAGPATAQSYPARVIKLVVPYTPGSPNDVMARLLTQHLAPRLGQPIVQGSEIGASRRGSNRPAAAGLARHHRADARDVDVVDRVVGR